MTMQRWYDEDGNPIWKESIDAEDAPPIPIEMARRSRRPKAAAAEVHAELSEPATAVLGPVEAAAMAAARPNVFRSVARILREALEVPDDPA